MSNVTPLVTKHRATAARIGELLDMLRSMHERGEIHTLLFVSMDQKRNFHARVMGNFTIGEFATAVAYLQADLQALIMHDSVTTDVP